MTHTGRGSRRAYGTPRYRPGNRFIIFLRARCTSVQNRRVFSNDIPKFPRRYCASLLINPETIAFPILILIAHVIKAPVWQNSNPGATESLRKRLFPFVQRRFLLNRKKNTTTFQGPFMYADVVVQLNNDWKERDTLRRKYRGSRVAPAKPVTLL